MSILETIAKRESIRTYDGRAIEKNDIGKLQAFINKDMKFIGKPIAFKMLSPNDTQAENIKNLAAYGMIKGAKNYIVGIGEMDTSLVDFGYAFEQIVLYAESIGLGTCWLGGTFKRKTVSRLVKLKRDEWIPAMMSVGYAAKRATTRDFLTRKTVKADTRKPFDELFSNGANGLALTEAMCDDLAEVLEAVRLAPSASNKQPWRLVVNTSGNVEFYINRTPNYSDKLGYDIQLVDMGIAMWHFEAAAKHCGIEGVFKHFVPDKKNIGVEDCCEYITTFARS